MYFIYPHLSQGIQYPTNSLSSSQRGGSLQLFGSYPVVVVQPQTPQFLQQAHNYPPTMDSILESHLAEGFASVDCAPEYANRIAARLLTDAYSFSLGQEKKKKQRQRVYELQLRALFNLRAFDRMAAVFDQLYEEDIPWTHNLRLSHGKLLQAQHKDREALALFELLYHNCPIQRNMFALVGICKKIVDTEGSIEELSKVKDICERLLESRPIMSNPSLKTKVKDIITRCSGMLHQQTLDQAEHEPTPTSSVVEEIVSLDNDEEWSALLSAPKPPSMMGRSEAEVREPPNRVLTDICERLESLTEGQDLTEWKLWAVKKTPEPLKTLMIR